MKKLFLATLLMALAAPAFCQTDKDDIKKTITTMFDAMRKGDSTLMRSTFADGIVFQGISSKKDGTVVLKNENPDAFIKTVGTPHKEIYDERITWGDIKIDGPLASAWTPYKFYVGTKFSHCGVDFYQLMKTKTGWKIIYIVDTRRADNCPE
ncbi:nuclear transport factor 2 family protein [Mucilaginibacter aquariorum]|uniref:Nuclear transport factor 2 family protein n=1 Tax=Mucilaginibacter aquariorum TaxID=2967225 RepID=A0ABT1T5Y8_9SPHI|nr:nuclear transport factor 2 family protein [Mucilaginibacter aquariorum]MCQ6960046.1 nuclear transport factor 2 family protein [Mucilaginibacter aquariorum]